MIPVDFHSHSLFSGCGVHTVLEMLTAAKAKGLKGLAITDHGKLVKGRANSVFF
jgi:putative hydrolase